MPGSNNTVPVQPRLQAVPFEREDSKLTGFTFYNHFRATGGAAKESEFKDTLWGAWGLRCLSI